MASIASDEGAAYDKTVEIHADEIEPFVTWGTNPSMGSGVSQTFLIQLIYETRDQTKRT